MGDTHGSGRIQRWLWHSSLFREFLGRMRTKSTVQFDRQRRLRASGQRTGTGTCWRPGELCKQVGRGGEWSWGFSMVSRML